jgi:serine protease Do
MYRLLLLTLICFTSSPSFAAKGHIEKLFNKVDSSVVELHVKMLAEPTEKQVSYKPETQGTLGSGVIIDDSGRILTAAHVVDKAVTIEVEFADGSTTSGHVVWVEGIVDLAMIQAAELPESVKPAKLAKKGRYGVGERVIAIGAPYGVSHSLSVGYLSGIRDQEKLAKVGFMPRFLQTDAAINKGNSGGPLFNMKGEVIGIVSQILSQSGGSDGLGFAVSIDTVHDVIEFGPTVFAGFITYGLSEKEAQLLNVPQGYGMLIQHVIPNSLADRLNFKGGDTIVKIGNRQYLLGGDVIIEVGGIKINSLENILKLKSYLNEVEKGDEMIVKYLRNGEMRELSHKVEFERH